MNLLCFFKSGNSAQKNAVGLCTVLGRCNCGVTVCTCAENCAEIVPNIGTAQVSRVLVVPSCVMSKTVQAVWYFLLGENNRGVC